MSSASAYLRMFSRLVISWLFLWQAVVAQKALDGGSPERNYYRGKLATAQFYLNNELPRPHDGADPQERRTHGARLPAGLAVTPSGLHMEDP